MCLKDKSSWEKNCHKDNFPWVLVSVFAPPQGPCYLPLCSLLSHSLPVASFHPFGPIAHLPLVSLCGFLPGRCHFSTFKQCQEWLSRLSRATARPAKPEDLFAFAYHAWCLGLTEEDQHTHLCQPGQARLFSLWGFLSLDSHPSPIAGHGALGS